MSEPHAEPLRIEQPDTEPTRTEPTRTEPTRTEPTRTEPGGPEWRQPEQHPFTAVDATPPVRPTADRTIGSEHTGAPTASLETGSAWSPPAAPPWSAPAVPTTPPPAPATQLPAPAQVTYLPAPTGPHWGLVLTGLAFVVVAAGVVANQLSGFRVSDLTTLGPTVLVVVGLGCALVGVIGMLARRRR